MFLKLHYLGYWLFNLRMLIRFWNEAGCNNKENTFLQQPSISIYSSFSNLSSFRIYTFSK